MKPTNHRNQHRGFNLVELLIAMAITAVLMVAVMTSLHASFMAYQTTTEEASTHTISRLVMNRMLTMIRTGREFGPIPTNPLDQTVTSDLIDFRTSTGSVITLEWKAQPDAAHGYPQGQALYVTLDNGTTVTTSLLLEGVTPQYDPPTSTDENDRIKPFTLQFEKGFTLYRATIDLAVTPDDNMSVQLDGNNASLIRLVASAMPRMETY